MSNMPLQQPQLSIALGALQANYRRLQARLAASQSLAAAVVKADAYGLGLAPIAAALRQAGAQVFFVATLEEGRALRTTLPDKAIYILGGLPPGAEFYMQAYRLVPVLNRLDEIERWARHASSQNIVLPAAIQIDTGMARLGLSADEVERLRETPEWLEAFAPRLYLSHLASAETQGMQNLIQLGLLQERLNGLAKGWVSLANSSGIFLSDDYHYDLARPGAALYGVNPTPDAPNPMQAVVRLEAPILQLRQLAVGESVGYGATWTAQVPSRVATLGLGYADGLLRYLSNRGQVYLLGQACPVIGRVSMDLVAIDVTRLPEAELSPGMSVEIMGLQQSADALAAQADTIGYEILTSLGRRYQRHYLPGMLD